MEFSANLFLAWESSSR